MKYLFINVVAGNTSTGRIAAEQCRELQKEGHECVFAYGRWKANCDDIKTVKIGNKLDYEVHGVLTRLFDINGFASKRATRKFLKWAEEYNPDVVWLHNIHGYYINIEMLFAWIKSRPDMQVKWTLHDCWALTGHCTHFMVAKCGQWKENCVNCTQLREYPACYGISNVKKNYERKKKAFVGVKHMTIITPSKWLAELVYQSYFKDYKVEVVYNKINTDVFKPTDTGFREKYGLEDKIIVLGVANVWNERKGLNDFYSLAQMLDENYAIVLVGLSEKQINEFSKNVVGEYTAVKVEGTSRVYSQENILVSHKEKAEQKYNNEFTVERSRVIIQDINILYETITGKKYDGEIGKMTCSKFVCIQHTDSVKDLAGIYTTADIFVNPTYEDNYPTVNLEALACETMVITYDTGGSKETIINGLNRRKNENNI